ncbi:hypothetical protein GWI33_002822 [Rhynchophorus ferrugineus]|uniref:Uncharacterized protein n=1 Tax=Rhynchophorus ferrugineus TaxID=354439 RepID=A0A834MK63_RHYFE|nr:hypothetical protein GWI33_002822 [Rhynchophorus ferrugineus]
MKQHGNRKDFINKSRGGSRSENRLGENLLIDPKERKAKEFLQTVLKQPGVRSKLIFLETIDNAIQTLQGTIDNSQVQMTIDTINDSTFVMKVDGEEIVKGVFPNKQTAKNSLAEQALELLKKDCFYIIKKKVYEEISTKISQEVPENTPQTSFVGSKAHKMMLKMGWSGKGLGVNEQGAQETLADTIDQNITRQGLGNSDVFKKVNKILEEYAGSTKITMLRFDPDFTSEERAHIHKIASKFGLKSKSEGKEYQVINSICGLQYTHLDPLQLEKCSGWKDCAFEGTKRYVKTK